MPVMEIHLVEDQFSESQHAELLGACAAHYADVLQSPVDRVRVFITLHKPALFCTGGQLARDDPRPAPYFQFIVLQGRPLDQRHALLAGFTDRIERILGVERSRIRGSCWPVPPEDWAIGGVPASVIRSEEVAARALEAGVSPR